MTIDITPLLERAKSRKDQWSEQKAESLANQIASEINGVVDWDGAATEDWVIVKLKKDDPRREEIHFTLFIYVQLPLSIISRDASKIVLDQTLASLELVVFDDYADPVFKSRKGVIRDCFAYNRNLPDDGETPFSANSLYWHTV